MRSFAQKQNQLLPASFARSNTALPGPAHRLNPLLHLQRTIGNQAVQRTLRNSVERASAAGRRAGPMDNEQIETNSPTASTNTVIFRKPGDATESKDKSTLKEREKKAELEFHSTIAFITKDSDSSSTGPSREGFAPLQMRWTVWNTGFETAPEHVDTVTVYKADRCSGCKDENDEILQMNVTAPSTIPITQRGEGEFKYEAITPIVVLTLKPGHYDVYVDLDVHDEVDEINKENNHAFTTFYVKPRDKSDPDDAEE